MDTMLGDKESAFRSVTPEEIAHYRRHGWVKLEKFVPQHRVDALLAIAKDKMGEDGERNAPPEVFAYFNPLTMRGLDDPVLGPVIKHVGRSARALMARRVPVGIRYFTDYYAVKLPSKKRRHIKVVRKTPIGTRTTPHPHPTGPVAWSSGWR